MYHIKYDIYVHKYTTQHTHVLNDRKACNEKYKCHVGENSVHVKCEACPIVEKEGCKKKGSSSYKGRDY